MTVKKVLYIVFLSFICVVTTEWINIEEIIGDAGVEINLEENLELETVKKFKATGDDSHSFFLPIPDQPYLTEVVDYQFLFENALPDRILVTDSEIPLFILYNQFRVFC